MRGAADHFLSGRAAVGIGATICGGSIGRAAAPGGGFIRECGRAAVVGAEVLPAGFVDVEAIGYLPAPGRAGIAIVGGIGFQIISVW